MGQIGQALALHARHLTRHGLTEGDQPIEYPLDQTTLTPRYTDRALSFIEKNRSKPFFLYLPHAMPHKPLAASPAFAQKSGRRVEILRPQRGEKRDEPALGARRRSAARPPRRSFP